MNASRVLLPIFLLPLGLSCAGSEPAGSPAATVVVPDAERAWEARWSPDGKRVAYARPVEGQGSIWIRNADGTNPVRITHGVWDGTPRWSPDGKWIAYLAEAPDFDIFLVPAEGGEPRALTADPGLEQPLGWLPDGSGVVYQRVGETVATWVVSIADGTKRPLLTVEGSYAAEHAPRGSRIAYELQAGGKNTIWVYDSAGNSHRQLTTEGREGIDEGFAWSPDGTSLLFRSSRTGTSDLWVANAETGELRQLTSDVQGDYEGRWSPDGKWIAFLSYRGGQLDAWLMPAAGGDAVRLSDNRAVEQNLEWSPDGGAVTFSTGAGVLQVRRVAVEGGEPVLLSFPDYNSASPRVSPDGASVLFVSNRSGNDDIWVVPIAGGDPRPLTSSALGDFQPEWSPDGKEIAFVSQRGGSSDIWVMPASGGEARRVVDWATTNETTPRWSPDGKTIAFESDRDVRTSEIWTVAAAGGEPVRVTRADALASLQDWSPDGRYLLVATGAAGAGALQRVPVAGGSPVRLATPPGANAAAWSPDGARIAYTDFTKGFGYLGIVPAESGGEATRLSPDDRSYDVQPRWSPDGTRLAYFRYDYANSMEDLAIMNWADRSIQHVTQTPDISEGNPRWTPDGKALVFEYIRAGRAIVTVRVEGLAGK